MKGRIEFLDKTLLEGNFVDGRLFGKGQMTYADGKKYVGNFEKGLATG